LPRRSWRSASARPSRSIWVAVSVTLAARITGFEARGFARAMTAVLLLAPR
jgi:hypothetical protein